VTNDDETVFPFGMFRVPNRDAERIRKVTCGLSKLDVVLSLVFDRLSWIPFELHDPKSIPDRCGPARAVWLTLPLRRERRPERTALA
jgi:hypothetical protein